MAWPAPACANASYVPQLDWTKSTSGTRCTVAIARAMKRGAMELGNATLVNLKLR